MCTVEFDTSSRHPDADEYLWPALVDSFGGISHRLSIQTESGYTTGTCIIPADASRTLRIYPSPPVLVHANLLAARLDCSSPKKHCHSCVLYARDQATFALDPNRNPNRYAHVPAGGGNKHWKIFPYRILAIPFAHRGTAAGVTQSGTKALEPEAGLRVVSANIHTSTHPCLLLGPKVTLPQSQFLPTIAQVSNPSSLQTQILLKPMSAIIPPASAATSQTT